MGGRLEKLSMPNTIRYRVIVAHPVEQNALEVALNEAVADGWKLVSIAAHNAQVAAVMSREEGPGKAA
jgi:hypothetical protein